MSDKRRPGRWFKGRDLVLARISIDESGCWLWTGALTPDGYGRCAGGSAHRYSYKAFVGPIAEGMQLDHLCEVLRCVNPAHLEPVDQFENMRRRYASYLRCANGHVYTPENTYRRPSGHRDCRACIRARARQYKRQRVAA